MVTVRETTVSVASVVAGLCEAGFLEPGSETPATRRESKYHWPATRLVYNYYRLPNLVPTRSESGISVKERMFA